MRLHEHGVFARFRYNVYQDLTSARFREDYSFERIMETQSKWLWPVTIASAVVASLLILRTVFKSPRKCGGFVRG